MTFRSLNIPTFIDVKCLEILAALWRKVGRVSKYPLARTTVSTFYSI